VIVENWMDPADLEVSRIDPPPLERDKLAIDVKAVGCNWSDTLIVRGQYQIKPDFPFSRVARSRASSPRSVGTSRASRWATA